MQRRWEILHRFEQEQKRLSLRKLTEEDSLKILIDLHQFAYKLGNKVNYERLDKEKVQTLARVHSMFQKVTL